MRFISLFAGIGGLDLGLERAGMTCVAQVEFDPFCQKVLAKHWPDIPRFGDIKEVDPSVLPPADLICGGFPCQPVSVAGLGAAQADPRWLWPEFARIIRGVRPRYVLVENVPGLLTAQHGRAAQEVFGDLAASGFDAEWTRLSASDAGAPHLRKRQFILAYARGEGHGAERGGPPCDEGEAPGRASENHYVFGRDGEGGRAGHVADSVRSRPLTGGSGESVQSSNGLAECGQAGISGGWWDVEPGMGRVAHGVSGRVDRLKALGNAVVPQVAELVGRRIMAGS